jgi:Isochorismatase family
MSPTPLATAARPPRSVIEGNPALLVLEGADEYRPFMPLLNAARGWAMPIVFAVSNCRVFAAGVSVPRAGEHWIRPPCLSAFLGTSLSLLLAQLNVQTVIVAGGRTSVEVHYSFVDAHQNDFFCRLAADCMAGQSLASHEAALRAMEYLQTGARQSVETLLIALQATRARFTRA